MRWMPLCLVCLLSALGCSPSAAKLSEGQKLDLNRSTEVALKDFKANPECQPYFQQAHAWAVFPRIVKGAFVLGVSDGLGQVYEGDKLVGWAKVGGLSLGASVGGQSFAEIIFFMSRPAIDRFKVGGLTGQAEAAAVFGTHGAQSLSRGGADVAIFTANHDGLILAADLGGQTFEFAYTPKAGSVQSADAGSP